MVCKPISPPTDRPPNRLPVGIYVYLLLSLQPFLTYGDMTFRFKITAASIGLGLCCLLTLGDGHAQSRQEERPAKARRQAVKANDTVSTPDRFPSLMLFEAEIDLDSLPLPMPADTLPQAPDTVMPLGEILQQVTHDIRLDSLMQTRLAYYKQHPTQGYSVLFFSASGNHSGAAAEQADEFFQFLYPDTPTYLSYDAPYYKLKAGNFRTRLEASAFLAQIQNDYPNAFVVREVLDIKHLLHLEEPEPRIEPEEPAAEEAPAPEEAY